MVHGQVEDRPITVESVDLRRYAGLWYEMARIPNGFQDQCVWGVTAEYSLRDDGKVGVVNRCYTEDGELEEAKGVARVADETSNARLEVSFFSILGWRPVWGDYWIIDLAEDYSYAVVCSPDRKYGWILARERTLPVDVLEGIFSRLREQGFPAGAFRPTAQEAPAKSSPDR